MADRDTFSADPFEETSRGRLESGLDERMLIVPFVLV